MSKESDRMLSLLQELAALKDARRSRAGIDATTWRKRRKEIGEEMKQRAGRRREQDDRPESQ